MLKICSSSNECIELFIYLEEIICIALTFPFLLENYFVVHFCDGLLWLVIIKCFGLDSCFQ